MSNTVFIGNGERYIIVNGYKYVKAYRYKNANKIKWCCSTQNCTAVIYTNEQYIYINNNGKHNQQIQHIRYNEEQINKQKVKDILFNRMQTNKYKKPLQLYEQTMRDNPETATFFSGFNEVKNNMYKIKRAGGILLPKDKQCIKTKLFETGNIYNYYGHKCMNEYKVPYKYMMELNVSNISNNNNKVNNHIYNNNNNKTNDIYNNNNDEPNDISMNTYLNRSSILYLGDGGYGSNMQIFCERTGAILM